MKYLDVLTIMKKLALQRKLLFLRKVNQNIVGVNSCLKTFFFLLNILKIYYYGNY